VCGWVFGGRRGRENVCARKMTSSNKNIVVMMMMMMMMIMMVMIVTVMTVKATVIFRRWAQINKN
jgi:hypothetical protein